MENQHQRSLGRKQNSLRPIKVTHSIYEYAAGSVLLEIGKTKILCAVTIQPNVPPFMRGRGCGWLTAEYSMLPASTKIRSTREISQMKANKRSIEISRLISRSLRAIVNLESLGERTIIVDCDVLQADGGTRTASITAAYLALFRAQQHWLFTKRIKESFLKDEMASVAVATKNNVVLLDPDFYEDSHADADFNFVMTRSGKLIEVQGGAEQQAIDWDLFDKVRAMAQKGGDQWFSYFDTLLWKTSAKSDHVKKDKVPLFSLKNRQQSVS